MKRSIGALIAATAISLAAAGAAAGTLDDVKKRGHLECGVHTGLPGFSFPDDKGNWSGLDVDYCRALAAAIFGDDKKVKYTPTTVQQRFAILSSGQVDLLSRNTTITYSRDASLGINFAGINFYEGQTFLVRKSANIKAVKDLDGATICVVTGSTEEQNLGDYFRGHNLKFTIVTFAKHDDAIATYDAERCDGYTAGIAALAGQRQKLKKPADSVVLTETISNDPQGPVVRHGDAQWEDVVRWVLNGTIAAEALGVTAKNVDQMKTSPIAETRRLLGTEGDFGPMLGLSKDWMYNAIKLVGNYGESYERTVGAGSSLKIERGRNALWINGGILFTPPFQ
ncbi:MAG: amino acid ABC transporter substrate-binding protein [Proteobacteria bacterium]|nr:amino acid ABC transporter substrate-binding protein [Pseudomonadota bacterium]